MSQADLIFEYYKNNPNRDIPHAEVVDWSTNEWMKRTGNVFRDPDRAIRNLHQEGKLIKINKGVYRYDPEFVRNKYLSDFTQAQKEEIFRNDNYKCVICGLGSRDGVEIHADHIKPKDKGGKSTIENGQTLCSIHNFRKKNYDQTESGKKMFIHLYELSKKLNDSHTQEFCKEILTIYDEFNINDHIKWKP